MILNKLQIKRNRIFILFPVIICLFSLNNKPLINNKQSIKQANANSAENESKDTLGIHFYELASPNSGDSFIITYNDVEILVDAGAQRESLPEITKRMEKYVSEDRIWDYVIATHADYDHIACFANSTNTGIFNLASNTANENRIKIKTLIDFDFTQDDTVEIPNKNHYFNSATYALNYKIARARLIETGTTYYPISTCVWQQRNIPKPEKAPESNIFNLDSNGNVKLHFLYNYYYDHKFDPSVAPTALDRNAISVCFVISYNINGKNKNFLFTGDLPENDSSGEKVIKAETLLYNNNKDVFKDGVLFFKAGHHGSSTSNSQFFIDKIKPQYVVIPTVAGELKYNFPNKKIVERFFEYTDNIYIPSYIDKVNNNLLTKYYGDIDFTLNSTGTINVKTTGCCDSIQNPIPIQDTPWFQDNIDTTCNIYTFDFFQSPSVAIMGKCTLVKYGHTEILINCGANTARGDNAAEKYRDSIKKIKEKCIDGILEYVIITTPDNSSYLQMVDYNKAPGVFSEFKINNLIDFGNCSGPSKNGKKTIFESYNDCKKDAIKKGTKYYDCKTLEGQTIDVAPNLKIKILYNKYYETNSNNSICFLIDFCGNKCLFTGNLLEDGEKALVEQNKADLSMVNYYEASFYGHNNANNNCILDAIKKDDLFIVINTVVNSQDYENNYMDATVCDRLLNASPKRKTVFYTTEFYKECYRKACGNIKYSIILKSKLNSSDEKIRRSLIGSNSTQNLFNSDYYQNIDR